ncbi:hypothetical protein N7528_003080 [Penicillium herquei]|nr:hypothetical protein N7528_003080 [Penicillium herquei]
MDIVSSISSVIAIVQLAGSLAQLCGGYIQKVKGARDEILTLQQSIEGIQGTVSDLERLLSHDPQSLPSSSQLVSTIESCLSDLQGLEAKLDPHGGKGTKMMRKVGLRALKWPLKRGEVESMVQTLERYKSSFILSLQVDQTSLIVAMTQKIDLNNLKLEIVADAVFDSFSDRDEVHCLEGTRVELLRQITEWALSSQSKGVFWLNGMAGTGKSTISRTVASSFKDTHLGASFFFKRGEGERGSARKLFPTLAKQLALIAGPSFNAVLQEALQIDPEITSKSLNEQFQNLLLKPMLKLDHREPLQATFIIIVIDALDECDHERDVRTIVQLFSLLQDVKAFCFRVFITSRPELPIRLGFSDISGRFQDIALHEIPEEVTEHDIRLFLEDRFKRIKSDRKISDEDWPSAETLRYLVAMSVPLFISAATVCRYVENTRWEPTRRLKELLQDQSRYVSRMDKTYLPILTQLLDDEDSDLEQQQLLQEFQDIVGTIILLAVPFSIKNLSQFLDISQDLISHRLDSFQSVLSVPNDPNEDTPVRILHLSFRDFLVQSDSKYRVDEQKKHREIASRCLEIMSSHLRKNMCNLKPGTQREDIDAQSLNQCFPTELSYSCRYWVHHFQLGQPSSSEGLGQEILPFLRKHFLHWVEAMSLLGFLSEVLGMINILKNSLPANHDAAVSDFLYDASRFIRKYVRIAHIAPLQLYYAGLIFAPRKSIVRKAFRSEFPSEIYHLPLAEYKWSAVLQTLELDGFPPSVAFSPDGQLLVSSSTEGNIYITDLATGSLQTAIEGHSELVSSTVFSPDGRLIASASHDCTVRLWDPLTGKLQQTLEGHKDWVNSVAFSPDGQVLASAADDRTVRLWNPLSGKLERTLEGHKRPVTSVAFSPDGKLLASASSDRTVQVWSSSTGDLERTLYCSTERVTSLAFSPDSKLLAVGLESMMCIWIPLTGQSIREFYGHTGLVTSVAFSPERPLLASGSNDGTVRLWNPITGRLRKKLDGHTEAVNSVAFSPDGQLLASTSDDCIVLLWDPTADMPQKALEDVSEIGQQVLAPASVSEQETEMPESSERHLSDLDMKVSPNPVGSMTFSPDNSILVSASVDDEHPVRFWDVATGLPQTMPSDMRITGSSVVFSPDGQLLRAAGRMRIQVWDQVTCTLKPEIEGEDYSWHYVECMSISGSGKMLACSSSMLIWVWDLSKGVVKTRLESDNGTTEFKFMAFSHDDQFLAAGSDDAINLWDLSTGVLQRTWNVQSTVITLKFSQDNLYLHTNLGKIDTRSESQSPKFVSDHSSESPLITVDDSNWICLNGERILWLPAEVRPSCLAMNGSMLALGQAEGWVSFIGFRG